MRTTAVATLPARSPVAVAEPATTRTPCRAGPRVTARRRLPTAVQKRLRCAGHR